MKHSKILITGGAGFIGTHLAERLYRTNKIRIFDNLRRDSIKYMPGLKAHPNVEFVVGDILNSQAVRSAVRDCDVVMHLAAIAGVSSYYSQPADTLMVNLIGTINVLEGSRRAGIKKLIYFSTSEVYGQDAFDVDEESNYNIGPVSDLRWSYAMSKAAGENLVIRYGEKYGFKSYAVRPFNIYGPRQTGEGAISNFLTAIINKKPIIINGNGSPIRAWCYVSDCVDAVENIMRNSKLKSGVFNIGNPREAYSTIGLARLVCEVTKRKIPIVFKKMGRSEIRVRVPNIEKARRELDFDPKIGLREGLEMTYRYFRKQVSR